MKLNEEQKFILQDDDGNLIIVTEIEFDFNLLQSRVIPMKGIKFGVHYDDNTISDYGVVNIQTSFDIDGVYGEDDKST